MDEKQLREEAIKRYANGESPKAIYQSLNKGKTWFFKWLKRYQSDDAHWSEEQARIPHHIPRKVGVDMEQLVINTRKSLEQEPYAQIGALAIEWNLKQSGITPPPRSTINAIIKRNNLTRKRRRYQPKGVSYPEPRVSKSNDLHEFDVVGPRYLKTNGRFYSANIIDAYDRRCSINPMRRQTKIDVITALIRSWQSIGIPQYLQMDNTLVTRGSNRFPRSFGLVIRLCLILKIEPVFIPIREPWRNAIIERFQDVFDKLFFRKQYFKSFEQLVCQSKGFEKFHNTRHCYSTLGGKTPLEKSTGQIRLLQPSFKMTSKLPIAPGFIHLIRFVRSNLALNIFGEKFTVPRDVEYEYVWATIDTKQEVVLITHDSQIVKQIPYQLPKTYMDLSKIEL